MKLKCNPQLGNLPALQWALVSQLQVDRAYQRSVDGPDSQALIRRIAQHWNWDLCQPLIVSRRVVPSSTAGGSAVNYYVIDGQHRWCAAKLRGDIAQLPCVVVDYASSAAEAASFVHLNQQRRPLARLDVFRAAVAGGDPEAVAILAAIERAGLALAPHTNYAAWKPGMVANISGIEAAWRKHGEGVTAKALGLLEEAFRGQVLVYAGTLFPGVVALVAEGQPRAQLLALLQRATQAKWRSRMLQVRADSPDVPASQAMAVAMKRAMGVPVSGAGEVVASVQLVNFKPLDDGRAWCAQCEGRVTLEEAIGCKSRHCALKPKVAA